jgi:hypothetical protein
MTDRTHGSGDDWADEDQYWQTASRQRPYAKNTDYSALRGGYRYGFESARHHRQRSWQDAEPELEHNWATYEHRGESTWQQVKDAVRDAWDRVVNRG